MKDPSLSPIKGHEDNGSKVGNFGLRKEESRLPLRGKPRVKRRKKKIEKKERTVN